AARKTDDAAGRKTSQELLVLEKRRNSPRNISKRANAVFAQCAIALKKRFSSPPAGHPSMVPAPGASQTPRVYHLKELNRQQRFCCWIDIVFAAQLDLPVEPVPRRRRMCCAP